MKNIIIIALFIIGFTSLHSFFGSKSSASTNQEINFQGKIVNKTSGTNLTSGSPACVKSGTDTCDFRVSVYSDDAGGTALWSEIFTDIELGDFDGVFNLRIGSYCITNQGGSWTSDGDAGGSRCVVNGGVIWGEDSTLYLEIQFDFDDTAGLNSFSSPEIFSRKLLTTVPFAFSSINAENLVVDLTYNDTGEGTINAGTIVILDDSIDNGFTTTASENDTKVLGVLVSNGCSDNNSCRVQIGGKVTVNANTGITRGQYLYTSTTSGEVKGSNDPGEDGSIGIALNDEASGVVTMLINKQASTAITAPDGWYSADWFYRKSLTINNSEVSGTTHADFPIMINLGSDSDLAAKAQDSGNDILFTSADGLTKLDHEIERFNGSTGELIAWVRIPTLSGTVDTNIYAYYGNLSVGNQENVEDVWDSNYAVVQHLSETPSNGSPGYLDSTVNNNDGTPQNFGGVSGSTTDATGQIDGADWFDGTDDFINIPRDASFEPSSAVTVQAWFNWDDATNSNNGKVVGKSKDTVTSPFTSYTLTQNGAVNDIKASINVNGSALTMTAVALSTGTWHHIVATWTSGDNLRLFIDGVQVQTSPTAPTGTITYWNTPLRIGHNSNDEANNQIDGLIDEVRVSTSVRSADWIQTEYNNQSDPGTFYTLASEESIGGATEDQYIKFRPGSAQSSGNTNNPLIYLNEDGSGTPRLIDIRVGGTETFIVDNTGDVTIAGGDITGANGVTITLGESAGEASLNANFVPSVDATYDIGSSSLRWKDGYFSGTVQVGATLQLNDDYIRDTNGALVLQSDNDDDDFIYITQTDDGGPNTPGIFWAGVQSYTNDPGIRVNPDTGQLEFRDQDNNTWLAFNNFLQISDDYNLQGNVTVGSPTQPVNLTVYGDIVTGGRSQITAFGSPNVASFVYNTFNDEDTGSWRNSDVAKGTSWYSEPNDEDGLFCDGSINDNNRCGKQEFPALASIFANANNLYIYDSNLDRMWMRFDIGTNRPIVGTVTDIYAKDGVLYVSTRNSANGGLFVINFKEDRVYRYGSTNRAFSTQVIANRDSQTFTFDQTVTNHWEAFRVLDVNVNDVDVTKFNGIEYISLATDSLVQIIDTSYQPTFTSEINVGGATGIATANTTSGTNFAMQAWDLSDTGVWTSAVNNLGTNQLRLQQAETVTRYSVKCGADVLECPEDWTFQGSNNGTDWTTLDTQVLATQSANAELFYNISSPASFEYYRINVSDVVNASNDAVTIDQIQLLKAGELKLASKIIAADGNQRYTVLTSSNQAHADRLIDFHTNITWKSEQGDTRPEFIFRMAQPVEISYFALTGYENVDGNYGSTSAVTAFDFYGGNDGVTWTALSFSSATYANQYDRKFFNTGNDTDYKYYRIQARNNNGNANYSSVAEIELKAPLITASGQNNSTNYSAQNIVFQSANKTSYFWRSNVNTNTWVLYDFSIEADNIAMNHYSIVLHPTDINCTDPNNWIIQGSNIAIPSTTRDSADWTLLHTVTNNGNGTDNTRQTFTFTNSTGYRYYRMWIDSGVAAATPCIGALEFSGERIKTIQENVSVNNTEEFLTDGDVSSQWSTASIVDIAGSSGPFQIYKDFGGDSERVIGLFYNSPGGVNNLRTWTLSGSDNFLNWTKIGEKINNTDQTSYTYFTNTTSYRYYRLAIYASGTVGNVTSIRELDFVLAKKFESVASDSQNNALVANVFEQKLELFTNNATNSNDLYIIGNSTLNFFTNPYGLSGPPNDGVSELNFTNNEFYFTSGGGVDVFSLNSSSVPVRQNVYSNRVTGNYLMFFDFEDSISIGNAADPWSIIDKSGNNTLLGTKVGTPTIESSPIGTKSLEVLNASNEWFTLQDAYSPSLINTNLSICAWLNPASSGQSTKGIIGDMTAGFSQGWYLGLTATNQVQFGADSGTTTFTAAVLTNGTWTHVCVTLDAIANSAKVYLNGTLITSTTNNGIINDGEKLHIGNVGDAGATSTDFNGRIDDLMLHNELLSEQDIKALYNRRHATSSFSGITANTGNSSTSIGASTLSLTPDELRNLTVEIIGGTGSGQVRSITSNSSTTLSVSPAWNVTPNGTSVFRVTSHSLPSSVKQTKFAARMEGKVLIGLNNSADGGGMVVMDYTPSTKSKYSLSNVKYYNSNAGLLDSNTNTWFSSYNDVIGGGYADQKTFIFSDSHYWAEKPGESILDKINKIQNTSTAGTGGITPVTSSSSLLNNQVTRYGFSFVEGTGSSPSATRIMDFGIAYDSQPLVFISTVGISNNAPDSIDDCAASNSDNILTTARTISNRGFTAVVRNTDTFGTTLTFTNLVASRWYCFSWMAIGTVSNIGGADLAENFLTRDLTMEAGDVVGIDLENDVSVTKTTTQYDRSAIGIVATQPSIVIGPPDGTTPGVPTSITGNEVPQGEGKVVPVALAGRVPIKVSLENGPIRRGDFLTPASIPGYAMKATQPGIIIGRALENFDGTTYIVNNDKELSEIDKLIELKDIDFTIDNTNVPEGEFPKQNLTRFAAERIESFTTTQTGKVLAFVQTGYYWGDTQDSAPATIAEDNITDSVENETVDTLPTDTELTEDNVSDVSVSDEDIASENKTLDFSNYITPQPDDSVIGSFTLGRLILREDSTSINSINDRLRFQAISDQPIEFFGGSMIFDKFGNIITLGSIKADTLFINQIFVDKTSGEGTIPADTNQVYVENPYVTEDSSIFLTSDQFITYRIRSIDPGKGFFIEFRETPSEPVKFKYLFFN